jgi:hypothetical protein
MYSVCNPESALRALRRGIQEATGDLVQIEMPTWSTASQLPNLLDPLKLGKADVVCGSRFPGSRPHRVLYFGHFVSNQLLTLLSNCLTNINLSDMETCCKAFRREIIQAIPIEENRFTFEPEITVKGVKGRGGSMKSASAAGVAPTKKARRSPGRTGFAVSGPCYDTPSPSPASFLMIPEVASNLGQATRQPDRERGFLAHA